MRDNQSRHFEVYYEPLHEWFDINAYPSSDGLAVYFRVIDERIPSKTCCASPSV